MVKLQLRKMPSHCAYEEGYNLDAARKIGSKRDGLRLFLVGGMRRTAHMEEVLERGYADYISLSGPFAAD